VLATSVIHPEISPVFWGKTNGRVSWYLTL
jgi:hypothetical protein